MNVKTAILNSAITLIALVCLLPGTTRGDGPEDVVEHDIRVDIKQQRGEVRVKDRISLPDGVSGFALSRDARDLSWGATDIRERNGHSGPRRFDLGSTRTRSFELQYTLPLARADTDAPNAGHSIVWDGSEPWYARVPQRLVTFTLTVTGPASWRVVSQGARLRHEELAGGHRTVWQETGPQQEIYLIAAPFIEYLGESGEPRVMAFLRRPDPELADRYLDLAGRYIAMYEEMIGEYPYAKFALVENTWESGYGMPSFTLLGPRVIRLPFIPYTSFPHEILHNWWGNSVYVDYDTGNWSEGLTSYLADHWLKEQRGEGERYRRDALQKYLNFASGERDFPLSRFRGRHDEPTEAVGYNKSLMLFHMLRKRLGDEAFFTGLQRFYRDHRFSVAGFADLRGAFEQASRQSLQDYFDQWVSRAGAPSLALDRVELVRRDAGFGIRGRLRQLQPGSAYSLTVPVRVTGAGESSRHELEIHDPTLQFEIELARRPSAMTVDPEFDLFRKLDPGEVPPSLGAGFGAANLTFVVPGSAEHTAYAPFIEPWRGAARTISVVSDAASLPERGALWLLGWDNARRAQLQDLLRPHGVEFTGEVMELDGRRYPRTGHAMTLAARTPSGRALLWTHLDGSDPAAMARRLQHYARVSYAVFREGRPAARGQWPVPDSPLHVRFPEAGP